MAPSPTFARLRGGPGGWLRGRPFHRFCGVVLALALSGCASLSVNGPAPVPNGVQPVYHEAIELDGRLSVRYRQNGKNESLPASFHWSQAAQRIDVKLLSPLGQTMAAISVTPEAAVLTEAGKAPRSAPDIDTLSTQTFGWTLPVAGLRGWLQGFSLDSGKPVAIAVPGVADAAPQATTDGWQLSYVNWETAPDTGEIHPKRIDLQRTTPALGEMAIRIVLDSWRTP